MNPELLLSIAAIVLSLIFLYIPGLKDKYDAMSATGKRLVMLGLLFAANAAVFGLCCAGRFDYYTCDADGGWSAAELFIKTVLVNQATYLIAPRRSDVP